MKAEYVKKLLFEWKEIMAKNRERLIDLDSIVGDGDLGLTMSDGFLAAYDRVRDSEEKDIGKLLFQAGKAMSAKVPSTMGTLMAAGLMAAAKVLKGKEELSPADLALLFSAYEEGVEKLGKAKVGEKTFLDGLHPAVAELEEAAKRGEDAGALASKAAAAAERGYRETKGMLAVHGRAAARGEASRAFEDPGAYVACLLMAAFKKSIEDW